jgi:hypothetical protein
MNLLVRCIFYSFAVLFFCYFTIHSANAALLYLDPDKGEYGPNDTFLVYIRMDNEGACVNSASVGLSFGTEYLKAENFTRGNSIFTLWVEEPAINNDRGVISFAGGIPAGYCGRVKGDAAFSNVLGAVVFSVKPEAEKLAETFGAPVSFSDSSFVYLNDGKGTEIKPNLKNAVFSVVSRPKLDKNIWQDLLKNDRTPPEPFDVGLRKEQENFDGKYYVIFSTTDKQSGLDYYEAYEYGKWQKTENPYLIQDQKNAQAVKIRAIDKAGNAREGFYEFREIVLPKEERNRNIMVVSSFVVAFLAVFAAIYVIVRRFLRKKNKENNIGANNVS